ncbi:MAG: YetF domain-containing protein [Bacilli bacterium]
MNIGSLTLKDLNIKGQRAGLCANVIIDGKLMQDAINNMHIDEDWVLHELKVQGKKIDNVLLATLDDNQKLVVYEKNVNQEIEDVLE